MALEEMTRRRLLQQGGAAVAALSMLTVSGPAVRLPDPHRRGGHPLARPTRAQSGARRDRASIDVGGARFLDHAERPALRDQALQRAGPDREGLASRHQWPGREPAVALPRRSPVPDPAGNHLDDGMLGQLRFAVLHGRDRQCDLGGDIAFGPAGGSGRAGGGDRGRLLGRGCGRARLAGRNHRHRALRPEHVAGRRDGAGEPARLGDERRAVARPPRLSRSG